MRGMMYQLKNIRRDKLCILTFLLPIILGLAVNVFAKVDLSGTEAPAFGAVKTSLTKEMSVWLKTVGELTFYDNQEQLYQVVNDPATQMIGVAANEGELQTFLSGDEWTLYTAIGQKLPTMYAERKSATSVKLDILPAKSNSDGLKKLLLVITMVTAMFMGCTFNAMSIIGEKEEGIALINKITPMTSSEYLLQKIFLGFCGATVSSLVTAAICIRLDTIKFLAMLLLILLSAFVAALLGLFIGRFSSNMMVGIAYIKIVMILYLAPPILFYLMIPEKSGIRLLSFLLPSCATFYGLMGLLNGRLSNMLQYGGVLAVHCLLGLLFYLFISRKEKVTY